MENSGLSSWPHNSGRSALRLHLEIAVRDLSPAVTKAPALPQSHLCQTDDGFKEIFFGGRGHLRGWSSVPDE